MSSSFLNPLSSNLINLLNTEPLKDKSGESAGKVNETFSNLLTSAIENAQITDTTDKQSAIELLTGEADDMSGLLLDSQKAEIALNLALQLRNKVIEAYNEIMRIQV